ncbi:ATP-binding cassette domain-containing protein [Paenibacillus taichungensis]|uniref:ABC transporter ATP-binding protein n=1 Tax=Paenibacillus taichungensis TaxID=484184 RepID=UPI002DBD0EF7|nr:ATP-binding cassette domain-containing protein [Paenibacillus taichungensis]MEC0106478.1 ATP-binding cassette domain-containing protein [Paenibacillus taichungensis]MEC0198400.1 ATP-binding cassette domain-containing protein [Paenibacillus taichungensis]
MPLEARKTGYRYGKDAWVLQDINMKIQQGEVVGLWGPSGCGKTSLGRILAGYVEPLAGQVLLDGKPLPKTGACPVQLVFQHPEKVVNPRWRMRRVLKEAMIEDQELLNDLGIQTNWLDRRPGELSGGELQRFCVARALGTATRYVIADEMTTMLDAITQAQIWHTVMNIARQRNLGLLIISHDRELLDRLCDRIVQMPTS